jgi:large subunit ribosomal protein L30
LSGGAGASEESQMAEAKRTIKIQQTHSGIGCPRPQREVLKTLGLRRIRQVVEREDTPAVRGAVAKIPHLVAIVEEGR